MTKKCVGCGATLQYYNENIEGYVSENKYETATICERCFRIKNYGDYKYFIKDNNIYIDILKSIPKNDLVILVMDLFNLPKDISVIKDTIKNPILLVLTKRDILPKIIYEEKLLSYIDKYGLDYKDKIIISSNKNYNFDELIDKININKTSNKIYVIGFTNAGKSTMINKLMYNYSDKVYDITTSMLPSTTLNTIEIKFNNNITFIDTPGLLTNGSIENNIDIKTLKKIVPKREIRPITYQIKSEQWIEIENLVILNIKNNNITLFISNALKISRYYKIRKNINLIEKCINIKANEDLVISGLGFIKFIKKENIKIFIPKDVLVYTRKSLV